MEAQESLIKHYEEVRSRNEQLRERMSDQSRIHEAEACRMKDEIAYLQQQVEKLEET